LDCASIALRDMTVYTAQLREQEEIHQSYVVASNDLGSTVLLPMIWGVPY